MRIPHITVPLALAALVLGISAPSPARAAGTTLPQQGFDSMLVDEAHGQVFVDGPSPAGTSSLVVLNADGTLKSTVPGEQGARGMALDNGTLYVARCNPNHASTPPATGVIDAIDTATLTRTDSFPIAISVTDPIQQQFCALAIAGGRLWYAAGDQPGNLTAVDLAAPHTQHSYGSFGAEAFAATPGDPSTLVALSGSRAVQLDVSGATPTGTEFQVASASQIAVDDSGTILYVQSFDGIHSYSLQGGTALDVYPAGGQVSNEAISGDGGLVVEGLFGGVRLFHGDSPDTPFGSITIANGIVGLALSDDGKELYAVTAGDFGSTIYHIHGPALPAPQLTVKASTGSISYLQRVRLTAHLGGSHGSAVVSFYAVPYGGVAHLIGSGEVGAAGNVSIISPQLKRNTRFYVTYAGDDTTASGTSPAVAVTVHAIAKAKLLGAYGRSGAYHLYHYTTACPSRGSGCPVVVGSVTPNHAGRLLTFQLQIHTASGWRTIASARFKLNSRSIATARWVYGSSSIIGHQLRARVVFPADADHGGDVSPWRYLEITR
ncbi:MAG: hypothetical protein QOG33_1837 [Gaiellales bacterium]|jgi:hypothetical protein|nr:hypothetical protein [Gaiellales bacterium]